MSDREQTELERRVEAAGMSLPRDRLRAFALGAVGSIPFMGGPLENLIDETIPSARANRIQQLWLDIAATVEQHEDEIERLVSDPPPDYAAIVETVLVDVQRTASETKRKAYAAVMVNALRRGDSDAEEREYFVESIQALRAIHVATLAAMSSHQDVRDEREMRELFGGSLIDTLRKRLPGYSEEQLVLAWGDLHDRGFINTSASSLRATMSAQGAIVLNGRLTDMGRRFVAFITTDAPS